MESTVAEGSDSFRSCAWLCTRTAVSIFAYLPSKTVQLKAEATPGNIP